MKFRRSLFTLICLSFFVLSASAQKISELPTVRVTGTAEIKVVPDSVVFTLGVEKIRKEMVDAKRENDQAVSQILALTKKHGILEKDVRTDFISVSKRYDFIGTGPDRQRVFKGYAVSKTVIVKLKDLKKFEIFFSEVLTTGVTAVRRVYFQTSKFETYKKVARMKAIRAAKTKANELAVAIGQKLGRALMINESGGSRFPTPNLSLNYIGSVPSPGSGTFSPGTITIRSQVEVRFLLN